MAYLSPGRNVVVVEPDYVYEDPVVVAPRKRVVHADPHRHYHVYGQQPQKPTECGYNDDDEGEAEYEGGAGEEEEDEEQGMPPQEQEEEYEESDRRFGNIASSVSIHQEHLKSVKENPMSQKVFNFEKLRCEECAGSTLVKDGLVDSLDHAKTCSLAKKMKIGCGHCHKEAKVHHEHIHPAPVVLPPEECESDSESSSSSEEEEECDDGPVVDVYLEECDKIGKKLLESLRSNAPVSVNFNKTVLSADGKSALKMNVAVTTSKVDSTGKQQVSLALTPLDSNGTKGKTISAPLWKVDMKSSDAKQCVSFNRQAAQKFIDANVQQIVLTSAVAHIDQALAVVKKAQTGK